MPSKRLEFLFYLNVTRGIYISMTNRLTVAERMHCDLNHMAGFFTPNNTINLKTHLHSKKKTEQKKKRKEETKNWNDISTLVANSLSRSSNKSRDII